MTREIKGEVLELPFFKGRLSKNDQVKRGTFFFNGIKNCGKESN